MTDMRDRCSECAMTRDDRSAYQGDCPMKFPEVGCPFHGSTTDILHKELFEAWAAKDGTYDLRPAKVKVISVNGVPYDGLVRHYLQDRTMYTYQGFIAGVNAEYQAQERSGTDGRLQ